MHREKRRYILFEIIGEEPVSKMNAVWAIKSKIIELLKTDNTGFAIYNFDEKTQRGEIKVNNKSIAELKNILAQIDKISNQEAVINIKKVSGTLKSLRS